MTPQRFSSLRSHRTYLCDCTLLDWLECRRTGVRAKVPTASDKLGLRFADQVGVQVYVVEDGNAAKVGSGIGAFISYDVDFHDEICW